jgi:hypothetical protein
MLIALAVVVAAAGCAGPSGTSASPSTPVARTSAGASPRTTHAPVADPEANPTSTARVSTVGLKPAAALPGAKRACRSGDPLANVYHPYRLQVVATCATVAGVVESIRHEDDGDFHIDLALDAPYRQMLDAANRTYQHGWLVLELVPADQTGCTVGQPPRPTSGSYDYGICTGADERPPSLGEHIWVTGPYVIDHWHNWTEIHPIWSMTTTRPSGTAQLARTTPTRSQTATATAGSRLTCAASMTNASPTRNSTTTVVVKTGAAGAQVSATAHYKSTSTAHSATAGSGGVAQIPFRIGQATLGYRVQVTVAVSAGSASATCSTAFVPTA